MIEFLTVSTQTCVLLERADEYESKDFIAKLLKLLPYLYFKTRMLPKFERQLEAVLPETFVSEDDYHYVRQKLSNQFGSNDAYLEVFEEDMQYSDTPITVFLSEQLADIYQELRNLADNCRTGEEVLMDEAMCACLEAFYEHWGQKLLNVLRALHSVEKCL